MDEENTSGEPTDDSAEGRAAQIEGLRAAGLTVIGSFEREGGGTVVLVVCGACGLARSPDHQCPYCLLRVYESKFQRLRLALARARGGLSEADLILLR